MKRFKNLYAKKKPIPLVHIAKLAMFRLRLEPWDEASLPLDCFENPGEIFKLGDKPFELDNDGSGPLVNVIGHSTCFIRVGGKNLLTDPVWSSVAGPFSLIGPKRRTPPTITLDSLPKIDAVLLSHDHYDHLDKKALRFLIDRDRPVILTGCNVSRHLKRYDRCIEMDWHDFYELDGVEVYFCPAQHFSGRGFVFNKSLWGSFVVKAPEASLYFLGDTGYSEPMFEDISRRYGPIDIGIIPIGAYKPYNALKAYHLSPYDAVHVHQFFEFKASVAVHFGTYQLSIESINSQIEDFVSIWEDMKDDLRGEFILPEFGQSYEIDLERATKLSKRGAIKGA
ncbi:MAG: MBL fold metallo-hydrolase [Pseudobacteriovorax sp.]|nr:MBL fold metallo-hydrolase [Pseudobacteriovorax sp.]